VRAFGAEIGRRVPVPGDKFLEIEARLGDSTVMIADEFPDQGVLSHCVSTRSSLCAVGPERAGDHDGVEAFGLLGRKACADARGTGIAGEAFACFRCGELWSAVSHVRSTRE
jgi:hypothetical protein